MKRSPWVWGQIGLVMLVATPCFGATHRRRIRQPEGRFVDVGADTASHKEVKPLAVKFYELAALVLRSDGDLLAADTTAKMIKVIAPSGKQVGTIQPGFGPQALDVAADGTIYCGGKGKLAKISAEGKVLKTVDVPADVASSVGPTSKRRARGPMTRISGLAVSDKDLFAAFGSGGSLGSRSKLFRFDLDLGGPKLLAEGLRGCCQRCDMVFRDGVLYVVENAAHRVVRFDRDGKVLGHWGKRHRTDLAGFGSCCNPMNLCFGPQGVLYTSESGMGRVKRYSTDGTFLGLVSYVGVKRFRRASWTASSCSNMAIAVTPDGKRVYVLDFKNDVIRVLVKKG